MTRKIGNGLDLQNQRIQNLGTGSQPTDAVNLAQLQSALAGLSWHGAVRAASTGNINLAAPGAAVDGITMATGQRFLAKNQTTGSENGPYIWNGASSAATRATDGTTGNLNAGAAFYVDEGTVNADTAWTVSTDDPITVGTTAITFSKFGAGIAYTAGTGLTLTGTQFAIDTVVVARKFATNVGDGSSTTITVSHNLGTLDVVAQLYLTSTGETIETDTVRPSTSTVAFTFATAPAAGALRAVITG
jgi:hypothetical protein